MPLKFIYTGYTEYSNKSLSEAFRILGYHVADFEENFIALSDDWEKLLISNRNMPSEERKAILKNMFRGYDVVIDGPHLFFWKELLEVFPKCRVIHHFKQPDEWYEHFIKVNQIIRKKLIGFFSWLPNFFTGFFFWLFLPTMANITRLYKILGPLYCGDSQSFMTPWSDSPKKLDEILLKRCYRSHIADVNSWILQQDNVFMASANSKVLDKSNSNTNQTNFLTSVDEIPKSTYSVATLPKKHSLVPINGTLPMQNHFYDKKPSIYGNNRRRSSIDILNLTQQQFESKYNSNNNNNINNNNNQIMMMRKQIRFSNNLVNGNGNSTLGLLPKIKSKNSRILILDNINCGWRTLCNFTRDEIPPGKKWPKVTADNHHHLEWLLGSSSLLFSPFVKQRTVMETCQIVQYKHSSNVTRTHPEHSCNIVRT